LTARTTRVSNPLRYPSFRASASVSTQVAAFAFGLPINIYEFYLYINNSTTLYETLVFLFFNPSNLYN